MVADRFQIPTAMFPLATPLRTAALYRWSYRLP